MNGINTGEPIADYPFTTLTPTLGVVRAFNDKTFVVADIPGLIEGASECKGLGIALLKSIERTSCLLHLVDAAGPALLGDEDPAAVFASYLAVRHELSSSSAELATRPELVALSNVDLPDDEARERLCAYFEQQGVTPLCLSSATGEGVQAVVEEMARRVCGVVREVAGEEGWLRLGRGITER